MKAELDGRNDVCCENKQSFDYLVHLRKLTEEKLYNFEAESEECHFYPQDYYHLAGRSV